MARICGVELRSSEAVVVVADFDDGNISHVDLKTRKISLGDDEKTDSITRLLQRSDIAFHLL
jgi:hypothetical protein